MGFGDAGVWVALNDGSGHFGEMRFGLQEYGVAQRWTVLTRPRLVADLSGEGRADLIGFREDGLLVARGDGAGGFGTPELLLPFFGSRHRPCGVGPVPPSRLAADLTGNGGSDILGFSDDGAWVLVFDTDGPLGPQLVVHGSAPSRRGARTFTFAWPRTSPATVEPTSWASATPASTCRATSAPVRARVRS